MGKDTLRKLLKFLNPSPLVGGLEITDSSLKYLRIRNGETIKSSLGLPPGVIEEGRIKDRRTFIAALNSLHARIAPVKKKAHVIASLSSGSVYSQVFNLPFLSGKSLVDAAKLNLQMISPIDAKTAYYDWQAVGEIASEGGQLEILGAFINSAIVDEFTDALREANFEVVTIEFSSLALARLVKEEGNGVDIKQPYFLLDVSGDGLNFMILRNGNLYFSYFHPWKSLAAGSLDEFIKKEVQRLINFYAAHWSGQVGEVILLSSALSKEITALLQENFRLEVRQLTLKNYDKLLPNWFGVLGAALRGLVPRSQDDLISLAAAGTEERYYRWQIMNFIDIWRNAILASLGFIFLAFIIVDSFFAHNLNAIKRQLGLGLAAPAVNEITQLQDGAKEFNRLVELASGAAKQSPKRSPLFEKLNVIAGQAVAMDRVYADYTNNSVLVNGAAASEAAAINFKNRLAAEPNFADVFLPLASIETNPDGTVSFQVSLKIK